MKPRIMLIGGFLGAGKTTMLWEAAKRFTEKGRRVGLITNDQASELVDTALLEHMSGTVSEVSGSCFCCNFQGLTDAIFHLASEKKAEIIIAEPVGSCTDLSATILQPLKKKFKNDLIVSPLTVLIDPDRLETLLDEAASELHPSSAYILQKQLEEADIIAINKTDLLTQESIDALKKRAADKWPETAIFSVSAKNGYGIELWLDAAMNYLDSGTRLAEVDYDIYAEGEAVLGWLNATFWLKSEKADWNAFIKNLLTSLSLSFDSSNSPVGHVKLLLEAADWYVIGNVTGKKETINIRGQAAVEKEVKMTINARVQMDPNTLKSVILEEISAACTNGITYTTKALKCLAPGRPNPTYRYDYVEAKNY